MLEVLGVTVVIVALPVIGADLGLAGGGLQLVVSLYAVLYGGLLLAAGRLSDVVGRRVVLHVGLVVTGIGTMLCATAAGSVVLLIGRAIQGVGGALVTPAALALLTTAFKSGVPRRRAISAWTAAAAGGGALGFGAGGVMVGLVGWRAVFWLLTVVAGVVLALSWRVVPVDSPVAKRRGLDPVGTVTAVAGLVLLVIGAGLVGIPGVAPVLPAVLLVAGAVSLGGFVLTQRYGRDPLLEWSALTHRRFLRANGVAFVNTATTSASGTLVALVAGDLFGLRPLLTGLVLLPFSIMVVVGSSVGGYWLRRPERIGMATGLAVVAVSMGGMAVATATRSLPVLAVAVAVAGLGLSWAAMTSTDAATAALPGERQGTAAGAVNTAAQVGTALGVAVLVTVASLVDGESAVEGRGYVIAFAVAAGLAGVVALALAIKRWDMTRTSPTPSA
ncbi:MFS transporter [Saccharothrix sp. Mg75]|uniref:MFS transporter n=1 Tax=Saccharothrix sp. Mg75 TaxID=3445357 RepID=UPI003EEA8ED8